MESSPLRFVRPSHLLHRSTSSPELSLTTVTAELARCADRITILERQSHSLYDMLHATDAAHTHLDSRTASAESTSHFLSETISSRLSTLEFHFQTLAPRVTALETLSSHLAADNDTLTARTDALTASTHDAAAALDHHAGLHATELRARKTATRKVVGLQEDGARVERRVQDLVAFARALEPQVEELRKLLLRRGTDVDARLEEVAGRVALLEAAGGLGGELDEVGERMEHAAASAAGLHEDLLERMDNVEAQMEELRVQVLDSRAGGPTPRTGSAEEGGVIETEVELLADKMEELGRRLRQHRGRRFGADGAGRSRDDSAPGPGAQAGGPGESPGREQADRIVSGAYEQHAQSRVGLSTPPPLESQESEKSQRKGKLHSDDDELQDSNSADPSLTNQEPTGSSATSSTTPAATLPQEGEEPRRRAGLRYGPSHVGRTSRPFDPRSGVRGRNRAWRVVERDGDRMPVLTRGAADPQIFSFADRAIAEELRQGDLDVMLEEKIAAALEREEEKEALRENDEGSESLRTSRYR